MYIGQSIIAFGSELVSVREAKAAALARRCIDPQQTEQWRSVAEAVLPLLPEDPSPKVRNAMADVLSTSAISPLHIVIALAADQPEVAGYILARSPLLSDADLVDRVAFGALIVQLLVAARSHVSLAVAAAMVEVATAGRGG
nr:DUF2336 domain-containing protein [Ochrobactrum sp. CM-21-5]